MKTTAEQIAFRVIFKDENTRNRFKARAALEGFSMNEKALILIAEYLAK